MSPFTTLPVKASQNHSLSSHYKSTWNYIPITTYIQNFTIPSGWSMPPVWVANTLHHLLFGSLNQTHIRLLLPIHTLTWKCRLCQSKSFPLWLVLPPHRASRTPGGEKKGQVKHYVMTSQPWLSLCSSPLGLGNVAMEITAASDSSRDRSRCRPCTGMGMGWRCHLATVGQPRRVALSGCTDPRGWEGLWERWRGGAGLQGRDKSCFLCIRQQRFSEAITIRSCSALIKLHRNSALNYIDKIHHLCILHVLAGLFSLNKALFCKANESVGTFPRAEKSKGRFMAALI